MANNSIILATQNMMLVRHRVASFAKWLSSYEAHESMRVTNQLHTHVIGRGIYDSNMVVVALKVEDPNKAKAFSEDVSLKNAMEEGGVTGTPSFSFATLTFQDTAAIQSDIRSWTTFTVKDWDAWQQAFEKGGQERLDNGLAVRAYGHDADNTNKVVLVLALTDTTKAKAYWQSDMLKQRRAAGGVIEDPERFLFRVVKRY
jgi:hypothetical protein